MQLLIAFYEPEILLDAREQALPDGVQLVSLLPGGEIAPSLETASPEVRDRVLVDPSPELLGSGAVRAILTRDFRRTAHAFPQINPGDIVTWPELEGACRRWGAATAPEIRFYGQFDPPVDKILYDTYFKDVRDGVFIEAGAADGVEESCCKVFEEFLGWTGINVEPSPVNFEALQAARPNAINIRAALSDHDGSATFTNALHPVRGARFGNGSLGHTQRHIDELTGNGCTFETFEVQTIRYDTLLERHGLKHVDLFVLDVEGHELTVLRGMAGTTVWPRVFCIEHGNIGLENLRSMLERVGYGFDFVAFNNAYFSRPA